MSEVGPLAAAYLQDARQAPLTDRGGSAPLGTVALAYIDEAVSKASLASSLVPRLSSSSTAMSRSPFLFFVCRAARA